MSRNKIDEAKLRSLGVSDEVIESMDIRDGGNIDPQFRQPQDRYYQLRIRTDGRMAAAVEAGAGR